MTIKNRFLFLPLLFVIFLGGCASPSRSGTGYISKADKNWTGMNISGIIEAWGKPDSTIQLDDGVKRYKWRWYAKVPGGPIRYYGGVKYFYRGTAWWQRGIPDFTETCELRLNVDITGRIIKAFEDYPTYNCSKKPDEITHAAENKEMISKPPTEVKTKKEPFEGAYKKW